MRFSNIFGTIAVFCAGVALADLHNFCGCGIRHKGDTVEDPYWDFQTDITKFACARYRNRHTGTKQWDSCPDCQMDTQDFDAQVDVPACFSVGFHMGGDEFDYYCGLKGTQGYCKSIH
ncbi:hypothetical protein BFW01_g5094 [Lasiodiplodia theobromae]|uniref:uncharacterized protein n=1 Tax=Lasiodiplodia theobromae TaxID=45133 RepID=UPI0015C37FA3|nr:uncharacterized protein LTHEOB_6027 [Lasiodiplodia theobromae]KAF4544457.1 hypothetical protein LTHEOB_6027 [Lasiodiplodia theobromae]KAF9634199.1 hypothetical protein BFW01_g5094 [Lasiodiplodia theobromae]